MSVDFHENLGNVLDAEKKLTCASGKIAPFAYTQEAYDCNCAEGVTEYNYGNEQNIPFGDASTLQMSGTVLAKGLRSQASSFTRMSVNHFFGRASFNVNKLSDYMKTFLEQFLSFLESNCNEWSPTTNYVQNDVVYMMTTINNAPAKRTFIADTASLNLPPVDSTGQLINTDKWTEVSGNVDSFRALSAEINSLTVNGISCLKGNVTADNDMTVHGNLYVDGTSYVVNEAQLQVSGDYQTLRNGAESGIGSGGYSGIVIENYNGEDKHSFIGVDSDGEVRVGKNAFTHSTVYTDISSFDGSWYEGLTRTLASAYPSHVFTAVTSVKLQDVAYNAIAGNQTVAGYYVLQNGTWYGNVTLSGGQFVIGNAVTDNSDIATLNALTRNELVYYVTITDNELQGIGTNQPVLTRSETTDFANGDILMWCASEKKAVKITRPASTNSYLKATLTNGAVSYTWEAGLSVDNATCFNGCTYAQACTDIRSGLTSCTGTVTVADSTADSAVPVALCTGFTNVGKSNCCPLTYNPANGELKTCSLAVAGKYINKDLICTGQFNQWILLQDITTWYNCSTGAPTKLIDGRFTIYRCEGGAVSTVIDTNISFTWGRDGNPFNSANMSRQRFSYTTLGECAGLVPVVICENATGCIYTALKKTADNNQGTIHFSGNVVGDILGTQVSGGGQNVTIPSGWTHLYEAPLGGMVSCAENATCAEGFRKVEVLIGNCCWIKVGTVSSIAQGSHLELTLAKNYNLITPIVNKLQISFGGTDDNLYPKVEEDSCGSASLQCIRFGKASGNQCPVDIYMKTNHSSNERYTVSYCFTGRVTFTPSFTCVSDTCASACACKCNIPLHANGHYINGCQFDTSCAVTSCVNASCCVQTSYVTAIDPGSTAFKVCNLTLQAFSTSTSGVKTTQAMTFCGSTGILTLCPVSISPNVTPFLTVRDTYTGQSTTLCVINPNPNCSVQCAYCRLVRVIGQSLIGSLELIEGGVCPIQYIDVASGCIRFYKAFGQTPFCCLCTTSQCSLCQCSIACISLMNIA